MYDHKVPVEKSKMEYLCHTLSELNCKIFMSTYVVNGIAQIKHLSFCVYFLSNK